MCKFSFFIMLFITSFTSVVSLNARISNYNATHIQQRHWYNANSGPKTSRFNKSMTVKKLDAMARKTIQNGSVRSSKHSQGRQTHQYKFQKPIGRTSSGQKAYSLRVVTNNNGDIITAFPVQ